MKKKLFKLVFMFFILIAFSNLMSPMVNAFNTEEISKKNISNFEEIITEDSLNENVIYKYDKNTNKTTVVDLETELSKVLQEDISSQSYIPKEISVFNNSFFSARNGYAFYMSPNLSVFPYRSTCKIIAEDGFQHGSGFLVGSNLLLTCAHCVFEDTSATTYYENWLCYPAYDNGAYNDKFCGWSQVYYSSAYTSSVESISHQNDWCLCVLNESLGSDFGWFGCRSFALNSDLEDMDITMLGYPKEGFSGKYQYYSLGNISNVHSNYFDTSAKNYKAMSGGPISRTSDYTVVGLIKGYYTEDTDTTYAVRLTSEIINLIIDLQ